MGDQRQLATWLIVSRQGIEHAMHERLGPAAPSADSPETEALRRFRTWTSMALTRGTAPAPNLEGLRVNQRRVLALLDAWSEAAAEYAGSDGANVTAQLRPLLDGFSLALRTSGNGRRGSGKPRSARRAVAAAIDRVADAFLAIDTDSGRIEDANPAAGALLGVKRDALLGVEATSFVAREHRERFWQSLDAASEGSEASVLALELCDASGAPIAVEASLATFATRARTLALLVARPRPNGRA